MPEENPTLEVPKKSLEERAHSGRAVAACA